MPPNACVHAGSDDADGADSVCSSSGRMCWPFAPVAHVVFVAAAEVRRVVWSSADLAQPIPWRGGLACECRAKASHAKRLGGACHFRYLRARLGFACMMPCLARHEIIWVACALHSPSVVENCSHSSRQLLVWIFEGVSRLGKLVLGGCGWKRCGQYRRSCHHVFKCSARHVEHRANVLWSLTASDRIRGYAQVHLFGRGPALTVSLRERLLCLLLVGVESGFGVMPARALSISVCFLLWPCVAHAGSVGDGPSFMMVSGISSSEEMCLTAADGVHSNE